jgi:hypothetical protein
MPAYLGFFFQVTVLSVMSGTFRNPFFLKDVLGKGKIEALSP